MSIFSHSKGFTTKEKSCSLVADLFEDIIPKNACDSEEQSISRVQNHLPAVRWINPSLVPGELSIFVLLSRTASHKIEDFLIELVRSFLLPGEKLAVEFFHQYPFYFKQTPAVNFLLAEFALRIDNKNDFQKVNERLPKLSKEIAFHIALPKYSKTLMCAVRDDEIYLQEAMIKILQKWTHYFDEDLIKDYHYFLALVKTEFKAHRSVEHQIRLICSHYFLRKNLLNQTKLYPNELQIELRILSTQLRFPFGQKSVLGLFIAINLSSPYIAFDERHILTGVQKLLPFVQAVKESFLFFQRPQESLRLFYLEIEKSNEATFSLHEVNLLKNFLNEGLKKCVETLSPSIFYVRNVEEDLRNILVLGRELHSALDIPQIMISFENSSEDQLIFRIILVRMLLKKSRPIADCLKNLNVPFEYLPGATSTIGSIDKAKKEASIFSLKIQKKSSLTRSNNSFNLVLARQHILDTLMKEFGEVRDYNGGIFAKQAEVFSEFKLFFKEVAKKNNELLEDFFHSLTPPEMQVLISFSSLTKLFELFLAAKEMPLPKKESTILEMKMEEDQVFVVIRLRDFSFKDRLDRALEKKQLLQDVKIFAHLNNSSGVTLCFIFSSEDPQKKIVFNKVIQQTLDDWVSVVRNTKLIRLNLQHLPISLDPRIGGDEISGVILKMVFEGLMRLDHNGKGDLGVAESVFISEDAKSYTFKLRECFWNNGDRVTAYDFSYAWKKILSPHFETAFAYLFNVIKNAKKVRKGLLEIDELGIHALDENTLVIELEHPCKYFLDLIAHPTFSPVNSTIDRIYPNWSLQKGSAYVCNGPFELKATDCQEGYELIKNANYWDKKEVQLDCIQISKTPARKAFEMFKNDEIDWLGRPLRAWEPFFYQYDKNKIEKFSVSATYWYVFNVHQFPFQSQKMRQAFAYAIHRQNIINTLNYDGLAAFTPLPLNLSYHPHCFIEDFERAKLLFQEALDEMGMTAQQLSPITIAHTNNELREKTAALIAQQWKEVFGITVHTVSCEFKDLFKKMMEGDCQIGAISWKSWINDPIFTLNTFKDAEDEVNFSKWENAEYQQLLMSADQEEDVQKRHNALFNAEKILIEEMPVIPIFHEIESFMRKDFVKGVSMENIDFKYIDLIT